MPISETGATGRGGGGSAVRGRVSPVQAEEPVRQQRHQRAHGDVG